MKHSSQFITLLFFLSFSIFSILSYGQHRLHEDLITKKDSIYILKSNLAPVTATIYGQKKVGAYIYKFEYNLKEGFYEGQYKWIYENNQVQQVTFYKKGKLVGPRKRWWMNGNKQSETSANKSSVWYKNGQLKQQTIIKDGTSNTNCWDEAGNPMDCSFN